MTHTVYHRGYGIELNLTMPDLGHPDRPGLLEELYSDGYDPENLYCVNAQDHGGCTCPGFMTLVKEGNRYHARHVNIGERPETPNESDMHKALKDYTCETAQREGFAAVQEDRASSGKRRTDVVVTGVDGQRLGFEIQLSGIAAGSVDQRSQYARDDGLTPFWLVKSENSLAIDRAPWARLSVQRWRDLGEAREALPVAGGVKRLRMDHCTWTARRPCPLKLRDSSRPDRCGGWHSIWDTAPGLYYDDVIIKSAAGELVPLYYERADGRRGWYMWVTPKDKTEFLQGRPEPTPHAMRAREQAVSPFPDVPLERDGACHYGEDSGIRRELARPRDSGEPIDSADWLTVPAGEDFPADLHVGDFDVPGDLIALQRERDERFAALEAFSNSLPKAADIVAGLAVITDEQRERLNAERANCTRLAKELLAHPWWPKDATIHAARAALLKAARG